MHFHLDKPRDKPVQVFNRARVTCKRMRFQFGDVNHDVGIKKAVCDFAIFDNFAADFGNGEIKVVVEDGAGLFGDVGHFAFGVHRAHCRLCVQAAAAVAYNYVFRDCRQPVDKRDYNLRMRGTALFGRHISHKVDFDKHFGVLRDIFFYSAELRQNVVNRALHRLRLVTRCGGRCYLYLVHSTSTCKFVPQPCGSRTKWSAFLSCNLPLRRKACPQRTLP